MAEPDPPVAAVASGGSGDEELHCPVCHYSLRGLPEPRCPECGYAFEWAELRVRAIQRRAWFYEHVGTLRAHLRTRARTLWPWAFWSHVHAYTSADPRRLRRYRATTLGLLLTAAAVLAAVPVVSNWSSRVSMGIATSRPMVFSFAPPPWWSNNGSGRMTLGRAIAGSRVIGATQPWVAAGTPMYQYTPLSWWEVAAEWLADRLPHERQSSGMLAAAALSTGICLALPAYWALLRGSVLRAQIRPVHLARVTAYTTDALPWLLLAYLAVSTLGLSHWVPDDWDLSVGQYFYQQLLGLGPGLLIVVGLFGLRLAVALRRYVRFPSALAVAGGYVAIVTLVWVIVMLRVTFTY